MADLAQECSKYGMVLGLKVPRPPPGTAASLIGTGNYGKVSALGRDRRSGNVQEAGLITRD
jgi:hypothetical protein